MLKAEQDSLSRFSRTNRLVSKKDFQSVFANARKVTRKCFLALYIPNHRPQGRLGIIVAKHHVKLAVERNRIKRVVRESFRHYQSLLKGLDIVILMRSQCASLSDKQVLRDEIDKLWQRLLESSKPD